MNFRRKEILKEIGLTPTWHVRSTQPLNQSDQPEQTQLPQTHQKQEHSPASTTANKSPLDIPHMDWEVLSSSVKHCTACPLSQTRTQSVFGVGDKNADWMIIGEGPGAREDEIGEPFVGQAGKLLDNMLAAIGLNRSNQVYITNIVKCRPPNNRNPSVKESNECIPYLDRQIALIQPKLIIALGRIVAQNLLNTDNSISSLRGRLHKYASTPLIVTYHPAYLLRALPEKSKAWEDLCFAKATMESLNG